MRVRGRKGPARPVASGNQKGDAFAPAELRAMTLRGMRWTVIGRPATEVVLLGSMVVLARLISPAEFGRFAVAAITGDLATIPAAGITLALIQRSNITREHLQSGFALALLIGAGLAGMTFVAAQLIVVPVFGARTAELVRLCTPLCMLASITTVPSALLSRKLAFRRLAVIDVSNAGARAVASIALAVAGFGGAALVLGSLTGAVCASCLAWKWEPAPLPRLRSGPARELLDYGLPAALASVSWVGFRNCDYAIVGARLGALQAGLYFRAYTLGVEYQKKVSQVMTTIGFPVLSRTQNGAEMTALRSTMVRLLTIVLFPLLALLGILAPVCVPWLFGAQWTAAVVPTQILVVGGASTLVIDAVGASLLASGRPRALVLYGWGHFAGYAGAVFLVVPYGLSAVALAAATVHTLFLIVAYLLMLPGSHTAAVKQLWKDVGPAIVSCAGLVAVAVPVSVTLRNADAAAVPYMGGVLLVSAPAYLIILRFVSPESWSSLHRFAGYLLPRWGRAEPPLPAPEPAR